jgi:electron transfer flavoprotein beta subunit
MNILVCFKAAPKVEMFLDEDWVVNQKHEIDTSFVRSELSSYDESALEMALKLSDAAQDLGILLKLNALTVDNRSAVPILKTLSALQFETVVRVEPQADLLFHSTAVAAIVSQYIRDHASQDVVMMGRQSDIGENAKTPLLTAEMLGWPCITQATQIEPADEKHIFVTHQMDDGYARKKVGMPVVISVGDAPCSYLRKPTLRDRLNHAKKTVEVLSMDAFDLPAETEALTELSILRHERAGKIIEGKSPAEKAKTLYEVYLKPLLSEKKVLL